MSLSKLLPKKTSKATPSQSSEEVEVEKLKKLINGPLVKIQVLQNELQELEKELNQFFDSYYSSEVDSNSKEGIMGTIEDVKNSILSRIAKLSSKDSMPLKDEPSHETLLKVEGYLNEGSEQKNSPNDQLSDLVVEYYNIIKHISEEKLKKPAHELKQAAMWINVKSTETVSKIKQEIINRLNKLH